MFVYWNPNPQCDPVGPAFGDWVCKEVVEVKSGHEGGALIQYNCCPYKKKREQSAHSLSTQRRGKFMWGHSGKMAHEFEREL